MTVLSSLHRSSNTLQVKVLSKMCLGPIYNMSQKALDKNTPNWIMKSKNQLVIRCKVAQLELWPRNNFRSFFFTASAAWLAFQVCGRARAILYCPSLLLSTFRYFFVHLTFLFCFNLFCSKSLHHLHITLFVPNRSLNLKLQSWLLFLNFYSDFEASNHLF